MRRAAGGLGATATVPRLGLLLDSTAAPYLPFPIALLARVTSQYWDNILPRLDSAERWFHSFACTVLLYKVRTWKGFHARTGCNHH